MMAPRRHRQECLLRACRTLLSLALATFGPLAVGTMQQNATEEQLSHDVAEIRWSIGEYIIAKTDQDMELLYRENLEPDIANWQGRNLSAFGWWKHLDDWPYMRPDTSKVILILNNTVLFPRNTKDPVAICEMPCNGHVVAVHEALRKMARTMRLPNTMFLLDVWDNYFGPCAVQDANCPFPILALIKPWRKAGRSSNEILVPQMMQVPGAMYVLPWEQKADKGFFRGTSYCFGYHHELSRCSRSWLAHRAIKENMSSVADIGLVNGYGVDNPDEFQTDEAMRQYGPIPKVPRVPLKEHARFRYLLNLDGSSASFRLAQLMAVNSLVLKQASPYIEYFYRSLREGEHYVGFWQKDRDDVFTLIEQLRNGTLPGYDVARVKKIVAAAQQFAFRYTTLRPRQLFWKRALERYTALWPDMQQLVEQVAGELKQQGKLPQQLGQEHGGHQQQVLPPQRQPAVGMGQFRRR